MGGTEDYHEISQRGEPVCGPIAEPGTSRVQKKIVTLVTATFDV
jgi:hypothetical protein